MQKNLEEVFSRSTFAPVTEEVRRGILVAGMATIIQLYGSSTISRFFLWQTVLVLPVDRCISRKRSFAVARYYLFITAPKVFVLLQLVPSVKSPVQIFFLFSASEGGRGKTVQSNKQLRFVTVSSGAGPTYLAAPSSTGRFWGLHRSGSHHLHWTNPVISTTEFSFLFR